MTSTTLVARFLLAHLQAHPPATDAAVQASVVDALCIGCDATRLPASKTLAEGIARLPYDLMTYFTTHPPANADKQLNPPRFPRQTSPTRSQPRSFTRVHTARMPALVQPRPG